ncbi:hypothetical protein C8Q78DRAFT_1047027 [Trametes maxima]|nr:hypothetical protein C8Q78DRAFT_1047027 [Trametes maxima]
MPRTPIFVTSVRTDHAQQIFRLESWPRWPRKRPCKWTREAARRQRPPNPPLSTFFQLHAVPARMPPTRMDGSRSPRRARSRAI